MKRFDFLKKLSGGIAAFALLPTFTFCKNDSRANMSEGSYNVSPGFNKLPRESVIHWHGLHIPPEMDGHPIYAVDNGEQYLYEFEVNNRPGTYWFHPHPDKITGPQVYQNQNNH